ncbi:hypothetical protein BVZ79_01283 [Haemophilus influenzae]|nr:hypothetical protein BVZ79_01283 [Haemophilus influenzae]
MAYKSPIFLVLVRINLQLLDLIRCPMRLSQTVAIRLKHSVISPHFLMNILHFEQGLYDKLEYYRGSL